MLKRLYIILFFSSVIHSYCFGQETDHGPGFQMILMNNPAYSGIEGDGVLRLSYINYYPGNNYNLHSVYLSFDSYFPEIHGGAGFYVSNDYQGGIVNDLNGGVSYAYFLKAGEDLFINAGLSASIYHRGFSFGGAILPDQIDPLGGVSMSSSEILASEGLTVFDIGAGFSFVSGKFFGGISVNHLAEPDISASGSYYERLKRKYSINFSGNFNLNKSHGIIARPSLFLGLQGEFFNVGSGVVLENNYLSISALLLGSKNGNIDMQTGFSFTYGKVSVFYNYRFSMVSGNNLLPLSLLHQTGLAISLYNVDKRNIIKTIKFPKM